MTTADPKHLTPAHISDLIDREEISLRRRTFSLVTVEKVFRYGAVVGSVISHYSRASRGGDLVRQLIHSAEENNTSFHSGTVILADEMEQSRGRFRRSWHAPRGGLWMTLALVNTLLPESSLLLPMAAGIACCELIRQYGVDARIKWVNDTLVNSRKISGILTETCTGPRSGEEYILIGIGINVNNHLFPEELSNTATSVKNVLGKEVDLPELFTRLLAKLRWNIGLLFHDEAEHLEMHGGIARDGAPQAGDWPPPGRLLLESYKTLTDSLNRRVLFGFDVQTEPQFEATVLGLDPGGGLILELDDSSRVVQYSGEIVYLD